MIYTFGDSFTKWHWPTWSDWLASYTTHPVANLAYPGNTNSSIYNQLLILKNRLTKHDSVYIMWTGSNRVCEWYDQEYVDAKDRRRFLPNTNGDLWFSKQPYLGLYKTHPDALPSFSQMVINNFDIILKTQWLLNQIGCDYKMMFWQNPWLDTREQFVPVYCHTWQNKYNMTKIEIDQAQAIIELDPVAGMLSLINWDKFAVKPCNPLLPKTYSGLWEFVLDNKELVTMSHNTDHHPNTLAHHDWTVLHLLPGCNPILRVDAVDLAKELKSMPIPEHDRTSEILYINKLLQENNTR